MKNKLIVATCAAAFVAAVFAADYTVPKTWTRSGAEYAQSATVIYDPLTTNTPIEIRVRVKRVGMDDPQIEVWTPARVSKLPDNITVGGSPTPNLFKQRLLTVFQQAALVNAYNWGLVDGREASMVPQ